jgi:hypothetical protein
MKRRIRRRRVRPLTAVVNFCLVEYDCSVAPVVEARGVTNRVYPLLLYSRAFRVRRVVKAPRFFANSEAGSSRIQIPPGGVTGA